MGNNSRKMQIISAVILVGLLMSLFGMPFNRLNNYPPNGTTTEGNPEAPGLAAFDLDVDYFHQYLDPVLFKLYNFSRDTTNTEFNMNNTYFHLLENDWSTVVAGDTDKYSYDNILAYLGPWAMKLGEQGSAIKAGTYGWFNASVRSTPLYNQFNISTLVDTGAFRKKTDQNGTTVDDTFLMLDNALAVLGLLDFGEIDESAQKLILFIYNYLTNTLWHPDPVITNNYFRVQNGTDLGETLTFYNLLGAYLESMVAHGSVPTLAGYQTQATDTAQLAFSAVNQTDVIYVGFTSGSNYNFRESATALHDVSLLKSNALGIATLADFYIRSGRAEANRSALTQAESLYQVICNFFYNNSATFGPTGAFMDDLTGTGSGRSIQTTLESNAYWLLALARLFEASGNLTYYEKGIEVYNQVVANLWDSYNLGFNRTRGFFSNDTTKSVGDNALFYFALQELDKAYFQSAITIIKPPPNCVIQANPVLNLTVQYNISWVQDFTSTLHYSYNINQTIGGANVSFSLRYHSNGSFITRLQNYTDANGTFNLLYPLNASFPLGFYDINLYANRTGFGTAYSNFTFAVVSNVSVSEVDSSIKAVQGESSQFNITFQSTRNNASMVVLNGTGPELNISSQTFLLANNTVTEVTTNFTVDENSLIGIHDVSFTLVNDSVTIFEFTLQIEVLPAVTLDVIEFAQKIVAGINGQILVVIENARPNAAEAVTISLSGIDILDINQSISLNGGQRVSVYIPLRFDGAYNIGSLDFQVNISRNSQTLDSKNFTCALVAAIEVTSVSTSAVIVQGREFYINFHAINNVNVTQLVDLYINDELAEGNITLVPGDNNIIVSRPPLTINPWDFTTYTLDVTLKAKGEDIFQDRLLIQTVVSVENALFFYVLPIALPIAVVLIYVQRQKKRELLR